jgi:hypothetical protein
LSEVHSTSLSTCFISAENPPNTVLLTSQMLARLHIDNLCTLHINNQEIGVKENKALIAILTGSGSLQELHFTDVYFDEQLFHKSSPSSSLLLALDLESNWIGNNFTTSLKYCRNLRSLTTQSTKSLTNLQILESKNVILPICDCLQHCPNLQTLDLGGTRIGPHGVALAFRH